MITVVYEGTPTSVPVNKLDPTAPVYWEAGCFASFDSNGGAWPASGSSAVDQVIGVFYDRRNTTVGIANASFLPSNPGNYGDESLYNQPGHGNNLYQDGTIIPANTIPTTTLLRDDTGANPNTDSRYVTVYTRGGTYATDQFLAVGTTVPSSGGATVAAYAAGQTLYLTQDSTGRIVNHAPTANSVIVGVVTKAVDGNGMLEFKMTLV